MTGLLVVGSQSLHPVSKNAWNFWWALPLEISAENIKLSTRSLFFRAKVNFMHKKPNKNIMPIITPIGRESVYAICPVSVRATLPKLKAIAVQTPPIRNVRARKTKYPPKNFFMPFGEIISTITVPHKIL